MTTTCLWLCLSVLTGTGILVGDAPEETKNQPLAEQFTAIQQRFEARETAFHDELVAANKLDPDARSRKITDENDKFRVDWFAMADEVRALVRAHPDDPAAFEGIILLPGTLRSSLDADLVKIVRDRFMDDPRMARLVASLQYRPEVWSGDLLRDVAATHPDRKVRGQAVYSLGMSWRYATGAMILDQSTEALVAQNLGEAKRAFTQVISEYGDVISNDGEFQLADKARAELARIDNLPNLKVGKVAPEIKGEDLEGKPLKLSDHRGKVVVVCFWATWCGPCMAMVPHERELVERLKGQPFALLGVNSDEADDRETALKATRDKPMPWPSWWDGGFRGAIQTAYNVDHWPTVYVLDPQGVIRYFDVRGKNLDQAVDTLLAEIKSGRVEK